MNVIDILFGNSPESIFRRKVGKLGLTVCYVIEVESNFSTTYYDTINGCKLWKENPHTKFFTSFSEAQDFLNLKETQRRIKWGVESGGYRCKFVSARVVPRVGKIVKDQKGWVYGRDTFIKSPEFDEEAIKYISVT